MAVKKKSRTQKVSSGTRHKANRERQHARELINISGKSIPEFIKPWAASKARRRKARIKAGKTYANWRKHQDANEKPSVSNTAIDNATLSTGNRKAGNIKAYRRGSNSVGA